MDTNQVEAMEAPAQDTAPAANKGVENTLGVIRTIEGLFNGLKQGTYPLHVSEQVMQGMNFLSQFHTQLVSQLPPGLVDELRKAKEAPAVQEVSNEPAKA